MVYCLKATKQTNDIDLKTVLEEKYYEKIKRTYNVDLNALLIMVQLNSQE